MKIVLNRGFTDLMIDGKSEYSPFIPGDEIEVLKIIQSCPDLGCCEVEYLVTTPEWNEGEPFWGSKYFDSSEIKLEEWDSTWNGVITTYYPPAGKD